ncbi:17236_t:CDS:1, partial [Entrophospora sp. SA101]
MSHDSQPQFVNVEDNLSSQLGRPAADVWVHFIKEPVRNSKGHFSAKCLYCPKKFQHGEATRLMAHLANHCIG